MKWIARTKEFYYFRRRGFPIIRLPDPDAPNFDTVYQAACECQTVEEIKNLRVLVGMNREPQRHENLRSKNNEILKRFHEEYLEIMKRIKGN